MKGFGLKRKASTFFLYYGGIGIIVFILCLGGWYLVLNAVDEAKEWERVELFLECYGMKERTVQDQVYESLKLEGLKEITTYCYSPEDEDIGSYYEAFGTRSDIIFLYVRDLDDMGEYLPEQYMGLSPELKAKFDLSGYSFYSYSGTDYGIKIHSAEDESYNQDKHFDDFLDLGSLKEDYYMVFRDGSLNFSPFGDSPVTSFAITMARSLLEFYTHG